MRRGVALVLVVVACLWAGGPVEALRADRVTLRAQVSPSSPDRVQLSGRVAGTVRSVEIQKRQAARWVHLRTVRLDRSHRYSLVVRATAGVHRYRAVAARRHSASQAVRLTSPVSAAPVSAAPLVTTAAAKPKPSDACGPRPQKADGSLWSCTFADDFSGTTLDRSRWTVATRYVTGSSSAFACAIDDPSVVSVANGALNLSVRQVADPVPCDIVTPGATTQYVAGTVSTAQSFNQKYGRFEARIRNTATSFPGLHEAFWLWPVDQGGKSWPDSGEIDVSETYSVYPDLSFPYLHAASDSQGATPGFNTAWNCAAKRGDWNTYALEWSASRIEFFVNGRSCLVNTSGDEAFRKRYIINFTQGIGPEDMGNMPVAGTPLPATYQVDYVRVWQ